MVVTPAEIAAYVGIPEGRQLAGWVVDGLAAVPVPTTDADHVYVFRAFIRAAHEAGIKPGARGMLASYAPREGAES